MLEIEIKIKIKEKLLSVASATLGTAVGGSGATALATGYFTRQNQYDNHQYSKNLYTHMMEKNNGNYTGLVMQFIQKMNI